MRKKTMALCVGVLISLAFATSLFAAPARVFEEIDVRGNTRFSDRDILVTAGLEPGVLYGESDLRTAIEALEFTGEFDDVRIRSRGRTLIISVDEAPEFEGGFVFGLGYDSSTGVFGGLGLELDNALGFGEQITADAMVSEEVQTAQFAYFDNDALSPTIGVGFRLGYENYGYEKTLFNYERLSAEPFLRFELGAAGALETRLVFSRTDMYNIDEDASNILKSEKGTVDSLKFGATYTLGEIDRSSDNLTWAIVLDGEYAFSGEVNYSKFRVRGDVFAPLGRGFALRSTLEAGQISANRNGDIRSPDRFVLGGMSLRGFERGTISVRDDAANGSTNLGGERFGVMRTDLLIPVFGENAAVDTFVFTDIGSVWELNTDETPSGTLQDDYKVRSSYGIGASVDFSFGRLEMHLAQAGRTHRGDEEQLFGVVLRSNF